MKKEKTKTNEMRVFFWFFYLSFIRFSFGLILSMIRSVKQSTTWSIRVLQKKHSLLLIKCVLIHDLNSDRKTNVQIPKEKREK